MLFIHHNFLYSLFSIIIILLSLTKINSKPLFGILSLPEPIDDNTTLTNESIDGAYINWLESAGAEVLPLHVWYSQSELKEILDQINGVLLQGAFSLLNFSSKWKNNARCI